MNHPVNPTELKTLNIPRGKPGLPQIQLDMTEIYRAENRLHEVSVANEGTATELVGYFNLVCNQTSKYMAWIDYEIVEAKKSFEKAKAVVVLDKMPEEIQKYKDAGIKSNEDFRAALIVRDPDCQARQEVVDQLEAVKKLLEGKFWSFMRAHNATRTVADRRHATPTPNFHGVNQTANPDPSNNFTVGQTKY